MPTEINDSLMTTSGAPLDAKYSKKVNNVSVPYTSVSDVNVNIPTAYRTIGLTVLVNEGGVNAEYWYKDGTGNDKLIRKSANAIALSVAGTTGPSSLVNGVLTIPDYSSSSNSNDGVSSFNARNGDVTLNSSDITSSLGFTPVGQSSLIWSNISGKPAFSTVATTGAYNDLTGLPTIPAQVNLIQGANVIITGTYPNFTIASTGSGGGSGTVTSVTGTTGRVSVATGTTTPVIDIASTYAGQSSINTVGMLTSGSIGSGFTPISNASLQNNTIGIAFGTSGTDVNSGGSAQLGTNIIFNIPLASSSNVKGLLTSTDWNTFNNKQNALPTGTAIQYRRGDNSLATFPTTLSAFTNDSAYVSSNNLKTVQGNSVFGTGNILIIDDGNSSASTTYSSSGIETKLALRAPLTSPTFTGIPSVPTALSGNNTTQAASTAFVQGEIVSNKTLFNTQNFTGTGSSASPINLLIDATPTSGSSKAVQSGGVYTALLAKQATLQSGVNIKTVGGQSILGTGDIPVSGGGGSAATTDSLYATDYGMIGDGTTVNSVATVQSFFNAISSTGKLGVIQKGIYVIASDSTLEIKGNTLIEGHGATLQLNAGTGSTRYLVRIYPQKSNIVLKGITFDGNAANNTGSNIAPLFVEDNVTGLSIFQCKFIGSKDNAGLTIKGSSTQNSQASVVECIFDAIGRSAIEFRGMKNTTVERCYFTNWGSQSGHTGDSPALQLQSLTCTDIKIVNNTFYNTLSTEFAIESGGSVGSGYTVNGCLIEGNYFADATTSQASGGTGISGYFNHLKMVNNTFIGGSNNHHSGAEVFGSNNIIEGNTIPAGSVVVSPGSVTNVNVSKIKIVNNIITCAATNGSAIIVAGYFNSSNSTTYSITDVDVSGNYISTVGGSGNSSAIKVGTYATTGLAKEINIFGNTIYSSAYGLRLEASAGSGDIYIRNNYYKQGSQFIGVMNNNLSNVRAIDNTNESGSGETFYSVTVTSPVISYRTVTDGQIATWNTNTPTPVNYYDLIANGGAAGNGTTDDTAALQNAINTAVVQKKTMYVPSGTYLIKGTVSLKANLHIQGAGIGLSTLKYDTTFVPANSGYMLEGDAMSYIEIEGITFSGDHDKYVAAFIGFNSFNANNRQVSIHHCEFKDANVFEAINLGPTTNDQTHSNTDVYIQHNYFHDLYKTGYQNPAADGVDANLLCRGIHTRQSTRLLDVSHNRFENISGDGLFGEGQNNVGNYLGGNIHIHHNLFYNCQMGVEINGNYLGYNQTIENNYFYWMRLDGGYAISTDAYNCKILKNFIFQHDRGGIEYTSHGGLIDGNTIIISPYVSGEGYAASAVVSKANAIELYGFANRITNNTVILKRWLGANSTSPTHYNCFHLIGMNTEGNDVNTGLPYQPNGYPALSNGAGGSIDGVAAGFIIENNYCENPSLGFVLADDHDFYHVLIQNNYIIGRYTTETLIQEKGDYWTVKGNTFNMTGNTLTGKSVMNCTTSATKSMFTENIIINDAWGLADTGNYSAWNNTFQTVGGLEYNLFSAPPMTQAQRTALTPKVGMQVYQTDGTEGLYIYKNTGGWTLQ